MFALFICFLRNVSSIPCCLLSSVFCKLTLIVVVFARLGIYILQNGVSLRSTVEHLHITVHVFAFTLNVIKESFVYKSILFLSVAKFGSSYPHLPDSCKDIYAVFDTHLLYAVVNSTEHSAKLSTVSEILLCNVIIFYNFTPKSKYFVSITVFL